MRAWWSVALGLALAGCAHESGRLGGEPDLEPPRIVSVTPEPLSVVPGYAGPVVIRYDERISERNIAQAVTVSPETGEVRVSKGRSELRVSVKGGWQPDQIYRIVVHPVIHDLFGNKVPETVEFAFSTGPPIPNTALAGLVLDRLTDKPVANARVEAIRRVDSAMYTATTDSAGLFAFRHIPAGAYDLRAYQDRVRNRRPDFSEPIDTGVAVLGVSDTVIVTFNLLAPDTTPARVVGADAVGTRAIRVTLDDHVDPLEELTGVTARIWQLPDSVEVEVASIVHANVFEEFEAARRAEADTVVADTAAAEPPMARREPVTVVTDTATAGAEPVILPSREIVVIPAVMLEPGTRYVVELAGVRNIAGVEGGGGSVTFATAMVEPRAEPGDEDGAEPEPDGEPTPPDTVSTPDPRGGRWRKR